MAWVGVHNVFDIYSFIKKNNKKNNEPMTATKTIVRIHFLIGVIASELYEYEAKRINKLKAAKQTPRN